MSFIPINPLLTENGAVAALAPIYGEDKTKLVGLETTEHKNVFKDFQVVQDDFSVSLASNLKISSIFNTSVNYHSRAYYFDAIAFNDVYREQKVGNSVISATRYGIGLRLLLNITQIETKFAFNLSQITAAVQLNKARAHYEIRGYGLGIDGLNIVLDKISPVADFNYETYYAITEKIIPSLKRYIEKNKNNLEPRPIAVELAEPIDVDPLISGQAVAFAVNQIARKRSLRTALQNSGNRYKAETIKQVYESIVGSVRVEDEPSDTAIERARDWWKEVR